jgi:hypothetical protein
VEQEFDPLLLPSNSCLGKTISPSSTIESAPGIFRVPFGVRGGPGSRFRAAGSAVDPLASAALFPLRSALRAALETAGLAGACLAGGETARPARSKWERDGWMVIS